MQQRQLHSYESPQDKIKAKLVKINKDLARLQCILTEQQAIAQALNKKIENFGSPQLGDDRYQALTELNYALFWCQSTQQTICAQAMYLHNEQAKLEKELDALEQPAKSEPVAPEAYGDDYFFMDDDDEQSESEESLPEYSSEELDSLEAQLGIVFDVDLVSSATPERISNEELTELMALLDSQAETAELSIEDDTDLTPEQKREVLLTLKENTTPRVSTHAPFSRDQLKASLKQSVTIAADLQESIRIINETKRAHRQSTRGSAVNLFVPPGKSADEESRFTSLYSLSEDSDTFENSASAELLSQLLAIIVPFTQDNSSLLSTPKSKNIKDIFTRLKIALEGRQEVATTKEELFECLEQWHQSEIIIDPIIFGEPKEQRFGEYLEDNADEQTLESLRQCYVLLQKELPNFLLLKSKEQKEYDAILGTPEASYLQVIGSDEDPLGDRKSEGSKPRKKRKDVTQQPEERSQVDSALHQRLLNEIKPAAEASAFFAVAKNLRDIFAQLQQLLQDLPEDQRTQEIMTGCVECWLESTITYRPWGVFADQAKTYAAYLYEKDPEKSIEVVKNLYISLDEAEKFEVLIKNLAPNFFKSEGLTQ